MKKKLFVIHITLLLVLSPGCLINIDETNNNEAVYNHLYRMIITPHNLSENASPAYSVGVRFLIPKNDLYYHVNQSSFSNDIIKEIVIEDHDSAYLKLSYQEMQEMGFYIEYTDFEIYKFRLDGYYYSGHFPHGYLSIWYNGSYEYLEIYYFERVELLRADGGGFSDKASCHVNLFDQGWNHLNTTFESDSWES